MVRGLGGRHALGERRNKQTRDTAGHSALCGRRLCGVTPAPSSKPGAALVLCGSVATADIYCLPALH